MFRSALQLFIVLALCGVMLPARAVIPGAADPNATTCHRLFTEQLEFNRRTLLAAYQKNDKRDKAWDARAAELFEVMAHHFALAATPERFHPELPLAKEKLEAFTNKMAMCSDPMVQDCLGVIELSLGHDEDAASDFVAAPKDMLELKYPPVRVAAASLRAMTVCRGPGRTAGFATAAIAFRDAITQPCADNDARFVYGILDDLVERLDPAELEKSFAIAEKTKGANPWLVSSLNGLYHIRAAWIARGSGWANTVTPQGWQSFHDHLATARDLLVKAHALRPDLPQAAANMITVAMGDGDALKENCRDWFEKSVKAQFDYERAYGAYLQTLQPRWGGSPQQMMQFAMECAATGRHDTIVPYLMVDYAQNVNEELGGDYHVFSVPAIHDMVRDVLVATADNATFSKSGKDRQGHLCAGRANPDFFTTYLAALEYRIKRYTDAGKLLDQLGDKVLDYPFASVGAWAPGAISEIRLRTGKHAKAFDQAEQAILTGRGVEAAKQLTQLLALMGEVDPGAFYLHYQLRRVEMGLALKTGDWVPLKPDSAFAPFIVSRGEWKREKDGAIIGKTDAKGGAVLLIAGDSGQDYEIQATIELPEPAGRATRRNALVFLKYATDDYNIGARINLDAQPYAYLRGCGEVPGFFAELALEKIKITGSDRLRVRIVDDQVSCWLNDKQLAKGKPVTQENINPASPVAIGIQDERPNQSVRFRDIQIRAVTADTDKPKAPKP